MAVPLFVLFLWSNVRLVAVGRELLPRVLWWLAMLYSLVYSFFSMSAASHSS
jgi:hypothetical protein